MRAAAKSKASLYTSSARAASKQPMGGVGASNASEALSVSGHSHQLRQLCMRAASAFMQQCDQLALRADRVCGRDEARVQRCMRNIFRLQEHYDEKQAEQEEAIRRALQEQSESWEERQELLKLELARGRERLEHMKSGQG